MLYGFEVRNASGEIVIDTDSPTMNVVGEGTLQGVYQEAQSEGGVTTEAYYTFPFSPSGAVRFMRIPANGGYVSVFMHDQYVMTSSEASLDYIDALPDYHGLMPATGSDYGMEVHAANGDVVFSSRRPMLTFNNGDEPFATISPRVNQAKYHYTTARWVAIVGFGPGYFSPMGGSGPELQLCPALIRDNSTKVSVGIVMRGVGAGTLAQDNGCRGSFLFAS